jgi:hypothetical protein
MIKSTTNKRRLFIADTLAMVIFSFVTGMAIELLIAKMDVMQSITSRVVAIPLNLLTARPYGLYRDLITKRVNVKHRVLKGFIDILIFVSFQVPVYIFVLLVAGANLEQIVKACSSVITFFIFLGRPYGLFLDFLRKLFKVKMPY